MMVLNSIVLLGDSDMSRWPPSLYPSSDPMSSKTKQEEEPTKSKCQCRLKNYGQSGAVMSDLLTQLQTWKKDAGVSSVSGNSSVSSASRVNSNSRANSARNNEETIIYVACAGENDIGSGYSICSTLETLRTFLDALFRSNEDGHETNQTNKTNQTHHSDDADDADGANDALRQHSSQQRTKSFLIFLGPKFEPWLRDDPVSRKQYAKLSKGLQRVISAAGSVQPGQGSGYSSVSSNQIIYIDCLTLFCTTETANVPGAVYGGKAMPEDVYFDGDGLHLSEEGYGVWKQLVEKEIVKIINNG